MQTFQNLLAALLLSGSTAIADPLVVDDLKLIESISKGVGAYANADGIPKPEELAKALAKAPATLDRPIPIADAAANPDSSVYIIGSVYKCDDCDKWHGDGAATAWVLTADGLMVTNYHVFEEAEGGALGVCGLDGKTHPILEIVAADRTNDIAVFRVGATGLKPLGLRKNPPIGESVEVLSHPDGAFFSHTFGQVSRYHRDAEGGANPAVWMSITAEYAKGSSGGPVLDKEGSVVGMVCSTYSIYFTEKEKRRPAEDLQMVVKDCVTSSAIMAMLPNLGKGAPAE